MCTGQTVSSSLPSASSAALLNDACDLKGPGRIGQLKSIQDQKGTRCSLHLPRPRPPPAVRERLVELTICVLQVLEFMSSSDFINMRIASGIQSSVCKTLRAKSRTLAEFKPRSHHSLCQKSELRLLTKTELGPLPCKVFRRNRRPPWSSPFSALQPVGTRSICTACWVELLLRPVALGRDQRQDFDSGSDGLVVYYCNSVECQAIFIWESCGPSSLKRRSFLEACFAIRSTDY